MTLRDFRGIEYIQEVQCSGDALASDTSLLFMALYTVQEDRLLASVNLGTRECRTGDVFSSCVIDETDHRKTLLKSLIFELDHERERVYGCNVTNVGSDGRSKVYSWNVAISERSKWKVCVFCRLYQNINVDNISLRHKFNADAHN